MKAPKDTSYRLNLQKWDEAKSAWMAAFIRGVMMPGLPPGPDGTARAEPLQEGRYRVVESTTGVSTEAVEVRPGGVPARLSIDISRQGYAKGKVLIPEGAKMADVRVLVRGEGLTTPNPSVGFSDGGIARPREDGSFMVRVPGDRPVTVVPWHPILTPSSEGGSAEVTEPREDLVLRLVLGARASLRFSPAPKAPLWLAGSPRILLYHGYPEGEPAATLAGVLEGDRLAFGGFAPGSWTLWIDTLTGHAPAVLRNASLTDGETDLGTATLSEGSRVRVKILVKEGASVPRIAVFATREDSPTYTRLVNSNGEETAVLPGIGPGRFRITAMANMGSPGKQAINEVHDLDGTNDLELTMDLR